MLPIIKWFVTQAEMIVDCENSVHVEILASQGLSKSTAEIEHVQNNGALAY